MSETLEREAEAIAEALAVIDQSLGSLMSRELISSAEVSDLLLDVRSLLSTSEADGLTAPSPIVTN